MPSFVHASGCRTFAAVVAFRRRLLYVRDLGGDTAAPNPNRATARRRPHRQSRPAEPNRGRCGYADIVVARRPDACAGLVLRCQYPPCDGPAYAGGPRVVRTWRGRGDGRHTARFEFGDWRTRGKCAPWRVQPHSRMDWPQHWRIGCWRASSVSDEKSEMRLAQAACTILSQARQVDVAADRLGVSRRHLSRIVSRHLGVSPKALIDLYRLDRSLRALQGG